MNLSLIIFLFALFLCIVLICLQVLIVKRVKGILRLIGLIPSVVIVGIIVNIIIGINIDKTSHNLWPFEIILVCFCGLVFSSIFWVIVRFIIKK